MGKTTATKPVAQINSKSAMKQTSKLLGSAKVAGTATASGDRKLVDHIQSLLHKEVNILSIF